MKRPLVVLTLIFCSGISAASLIRTPFSMLYVSSLAFLLISILLIKSKLAFDVCLACLVFSLGTMHLVNYKILAKDHIAHSIYYKSKYLYSIKGIILSPPQVKANKISFVFRSDHGDILVFVKGDVNFHYGDELILKGNIYRPPRFCGNARRSYRDFLYAQGIYAVMNVPYKAAVCRINSNSGLGLSRLPTG